MERGGGARRWGGEALTAAGRAFRSWLGRGALRGWCIVCGEQTKFLASDPALYRESLFCRRCLTTSRYRSLARGLLRAVRELRGIDAPSLSALADVKPDESKLDAQSGWPLAVYDTQAPFYFSNCAYPLPDLLARAPFIEVTLSLYRPHLPLGEKLGPRLTNQNLESLCYPDESFDIVVTSDVMEHVRLDREAHREIRRVLRPGGVYLFTVPHARLWTETLDRVRVVDPSDPSLDEYPLPKEYHADANGEGEGVLSYRVYGRDLDQYLDELGFEVDYCIDDFPQWGILRTELYYCRLRR